MKHAFHQILSQCKKKNKADLKSKGELKKDNSHSVTVLGLRLSFSSPV